MSGLIAPRSMPVPVRGAFFLDMEKAPNGQFVAAKPTAEAEAGLKALRSQISQGNREERGLALDILVNLAAGSGDEALQAQDTLRSVYANPRCTDETHNEPVRRDIERLSLRLCELALDPPADSKCLAGKNPELFNSSRTLSITVAYLGAKAPDPPNGGAMRSHIQSFLHTRLPGATAKDTLVAPGRTIEGGELTAAAGKLQSFAGPPEVLELYPDTADASLQQQKFVDPLKALVDRLEDDENHHCAVALINVGDPDFQHWMPLVLHTDENNNVHCHVMDSDMSACDRHKVHERLEKLLGQVFDDPNDIHIHKSDMQAGPAGAQACAALSLDLLAAVDRQVQFKEGEAQAQDWEKEASWGCDISEFDMGGFIDGHMKAWNELDDRSQSAAIAVRRAQLLEAWAGANPSNDGSKPVELPVPSWLADLRVIEQEPAQGINLPGGAPPSRLDLASVPHIREPRSTPAPVLPDRIAGTVRSLDLHQVNHADGGRHYASSFSAFGEAYDRIGNLKGFGPQMDAIKALPEGSQDLMSRLLDFERAIRQLPDSPLLGNYDRGDGHFAKLCNRLIGLQLPQLASQVCARLKDTASDLGKYAFDMQHGKTDKDREKAARLFDQHLANIPNEMHSLADRVDKAVALLRDVVRTGRNDPISQLLSLGGSVTINDRQVHDDAQLLLRRLLPLQAAMQDREAPLQKLSQLANDIAPYPVEAAAAMRAQIGSMRA